MQCTAGNMRGCDTKSRLPTASGNSDIRPLTLTVQDGFRRNYLISGILRELQNAPQIPKHFSPNYTGFASPTRPN